jgi:hypothetical protein
LPAFSLNFIHAFYREQRVKARRNNKELLREELDFLKQYLNISRVRTSQVAEGERVFNLPTVLRRVTGSIRIEELVR